MKKQTQQQRDFDQIIDKWEDAEDEVFRLQTLNTRLQQDYNRAWERLKSQRREIDELQKKLEQHERLEHEIKALFGIEMLQAVQDFADKLKTRLDAKAQHYESLDQRYMALVASSVECVEFRSDNCGIAEFYPFTSTNIIETKVLGNIYDAL